MAEYITKERAKDLIVAASSGNSTRLARMLSKLEDEHPADVVEVVHATTSNEYWDEVYCPWKICDNCKGDNQSSAKYCNWCGARLDGEE
ncbi:MAG: zinc ribbon domain-containing protein [Peptococcaceae bacterium]|nr:zinc ribbon domain-containing protein [Peptococcaceae bacterium]